MSCSHYMGSKCFKLVKPYIYKLRILRLRTVANLNGVFKWNFNLLEIVVKKTELRFLCWKIAEINLDSFFWRFFNAALLWQFKTGFLIELKIASCHTFYMLCGYCALMNVCVCMCVYSWVSVFVYAYEWVSVCVLMNVCVLTSVCVYMDGPRYSQGYVLEKSREYQNHG